ncbi:MAG: hypothetical protein HY826_05015 [Actinobacteria bacterium]|nr:hypothetical protein [Actinomycetota bacterium]
MDVTVTPPNSDWRDCVLERMRILIVAGIPTGVLIVGIGSRLAMLLLRLTSPDSVIGLQSDDDFTIGRVTLEGTYTLAILGAFVGIIGVGVYRLVAPWLIGPIWLHRLTTGLAAGAVVGSMLIHADGIDFTVLKPTWLAIGLFVALPAVFGAAIGAVVDAVGRPDSWTARGRTRWVLPLIVLVCFPMSLLPLSFGLVIIGFWSLARDVDFAAEVRNVRGLAWAVRGVWLLVAVVGLFALVNDISALY